MFICKFCSKECKNNNSLRNHERTCPSNLNRVYKNGMVGKVGSNQHIKASALGIPVIITDETRLKLSVASKRKNASETDATKQRRINTINRKVEAGVWHTSLARKMHINYNGVDLHGSWEVAYAKYLDANAIKWARCKESFPYTFKGKERRYTPDFYIIDKDEYVEIKGYKTDKDIAKWEQFPKHRTLIVLLEKDLKNMKILC